MEITLSVILSVCAICIGFASLYINYLIEQRDRRYREEERRLRDQETTRTLNEYVNQGRKR